jgi:type II secretion system protein G
MMGNFEKLKKGFTLIELLIVISLIGVLAGSVLALLNPTAQVQKANDSKRKSDLKQIQNALETYYNDNGSYPTGDAANGYTINAKAWGGGWKPYMPVLPADPAGSTSKKYAYISTGASYYLYACLDRTDDPQLCKSGGAKCDNAPDGACGAPGVGAICNYGVSSPDVSP